MGLFRKLATVDQELIVGCILSCANFSFSFSAASIIKNEIEGHSFVRDPLIKELLFLPKDSSKIIQFLEFNRHY